MAEEVYREIRIYRDRGLCDMYGRPLDLSQLTALMRLVESTANLSGAMADLEAEFGNGPRTGSREDAGQ